MEDESFATPKIQKGHSSSFGKRKFSERAETNHIMSPKWHAMLFGKRNSPATSKNTKKTPNSKKSKTSKSKKSPLDPQSHILEDDLFDYLDGDDSLLSPINFNIEIVGKKRCSTPKCRPAPRPRPTSVPPVIVQKKRCSMLTPKCRPVPKPRPTSVPSSYSSMVIDIPEAQMINVKPFKQNIIDVDKIMREENENCYWVMKEIPPYTEEELGWLAKAEEIRRRRNGEISPAAKTSCEPPDCPLPAPKPDILKGIKAFVDTRPDWISWSDTSDAVKAELKLMGATVRKTFASDVTHVFFINGLYSTYKKAKERKVPLLKISWIAECKQINEKAPEENFLAKVPPSYEDPIAKQTRVRNHSPSHTEKLFRQRRQRQRCNERKRRREEEKAQKIKDLEPPTELSLVENRITYLKEVAHDLLWNCSLTRRVKRKEDFPEENKLNESMDQWNFDLEELESDKAQIAEYDKVLEELELEKLKKAELMKKNTEGCAALAGPSQVTDTPRSRHAKSKTGRKLSKTSLNSEDPKLSNNKAVTLTSEKSTTQKFVNRKVIATADDPDTQNLECVSRHELASTTDNITDHEKEFHDKKTTKSVNVKYSSSKTTNTPQSSQCESNSVRQNSKANKRKESLNQTAFSPNEATTKKLKLDLCVQRDNIPISRIAKYSPETNLETKIKIGEDSETSSNCKTRLLSGESILSESELSEIIESTIEKVQIGEEPESEDSIDKENTSVMKTPKQQLNVEVTKQIHKESAYQTLEYKNSLPSEKLKKATPESSVSFNQSSVSEKSHRSLHYGSSHEPRALQIKYNMTITCFSKKQLEILKEAMSKLGRLQLVSEVTEEVTHVVCGNSKRTLTLLKGLLNGCWLLDFSWVLSSIEKGDWQHEEDHIVEVYAPAVKRFMDCGGRSIWFISTLLETCGSIFVSTDSVPEAEELRMFVKKAGGQLTYDIYSAKVIVGPKPDYFEPQPEQQFVSENFLLDSISNYSLQPIESYLH